MFYIYLFILFCCLFLYYSVQNGHNVTFEGVQTINATIRIMSVTGLVTFTDHKCDGGVNCIKFDNSNSNISLSIIDGNFTRAIGPSVYAFSTALNTLTVLNSLFYNINGGFQVNALESYISGNTV